MAARLGREMKDVNLWESASFRKKERVSSSVVITASDASVLGTAMSSSDSDLDSSAVS